MHSRIAEKSIGCVWKSEKRLLGKAGSINTSVTGNFVFQLRVVLVLTKDKDFAQTVLPCFHLPQPQPKLARKGHVVRALAVLLQTRSRLVLLAAELLFQGSSTWAPCAIAQQVWGIDLSSFLPTLLFYNLRKSLLLGTRSHHDCFLQRLEEMSYFF